MKAKKKLKITAIILLVIIVAYAAIALFPRQAGYKLDNPLMKEEGAMPILVAHRGGDGEFPGNTLEAFYNAYSVDQRVIMETDASITKDGVLILCHDTYLDDYTNVTGDIIDWTYEDLMAQKVDFGYDNDEDDAGNIILEHFKNQDDAEVYPTDVDYPEGVSARDERVFLATTLEELMIAFPNNIISVEIKQGGETGLKAHAEALRLIEKHDAFNRVIVASFHDEIYEKSREEAADDGRSGELIYSPSMGGVIKYYVLYLLGLDVFFNDGVAVLQIPTEQYGFKLATKRLIGNAHKHNMAAHYWTINDREEMEYLISIGADGIMTDYPHLLKEVYDSYGEGK